MPDAKKIYILMDVKNGAHSFMQSTEQAINRLRRKDNVCIRSFSALSFNNNGKHNLILTTATRKKGKIMHHTRAKSDKLQAADILLCHKFFDLLKNPNHILAIYVVSSGDKRYSAVIAQAEGTQIEAVSVLADEIRNFDGLLDRYNIQVSPPKP
ncbi:hypothetical protein HDU89_000715 [Geranomyces variabilis]|nr:hypothetical protein HDU89_000715 [Geranomyces variabilis]